jgi:NAD(P)-dependent dehydrogenase (short-subunit alcohol dehydrogenase family)
MKKSLENKEKVNNMLRHVPLSRVGKPNDLAGAILFLASKASDYVTGHDLLVDGGYRLR